MFQPAGGPGGEGGRLGHQCSCRQRDGQVGKLFLKMRGYRPFKAITGTGTGSTVVPYGTYRILSQPDRIFQVCATP